MERALAALKQTAAGEANVMEDACTSAHATEGEIVRALLKVWGSYRETPVF